MSFKAKASAKCLSILGTGSEVGKSIVVTALCRIFSDLGLRVAPFKAQNMSNNSFVTLDGEEIGRAQAVQADAARVPIHVDMNPVLLKPSTDTVIQVIVHGRAIMDHSASNYYTNTDWLFSQAQGSLKRLRSTYDFVIMEGAGSCAEVNLRDRDFANFRMARVADAPVILVADIDRGGVFAQIFGTLALVPLEDRKRVRGFIINRFRGDPSLFKDGIDYIQNHTGIPVLGLIPYYHNIEIDSEDGVVLDTMVDPPGGPEQGKINIAVLRLPHISNFNDFAPLSREPLVSLHYLFKPRPLKGYDAVILPGTKNVRSDLAWVREKGWDAYLDKYINQGGQLVGICGGYQMLGRSIYDPLGIEGLPGRDEGLGFLDVETTLKREKILSRSTGVWMANGESVEGYEIHMGVTEHISKMPYVIKVTTRNGTITNDADGASTYDGNRWGTYFHGLFDLPGPRRSFLKKLNQELYLKTGEGQTENEIDFRNRQYDLLAKHFLDHLNMQKLIDIVGIKANVWESDYE